MILLGRVPQINPPDITNPDDWEPGLRFHRKSLNTKTVTRAKTADVLLVALQHNLRKDNEDHRHRKPIDAARTANNSVLRGPSDPSVANEVAMSVLDEFGTGLKALRVDTIVALELVCNPPDGWDVPEFYDVCLRHADRRYQHIVSAVVHRDQKRPHLHVLALAVVDGKLISSAMTNGPENRFEVELSEFMAIMRSELGLRPDREPNQVAFAKRERYFERRADADDGNSLAQLPSPSGIAQLPSPKTAAVAATASQESHTPESISDSLAHGLPDPDLILRSVPSTSESLSEVVPAAPFLSASTSPETAKHERISPTPPASPVSTEVAAPALATGTAKNEAWRHERSASDAPASPATRKATAATDELGERHHPDQHQQSRGALQTAPTLPAAARTCRDCAHRLGYGTCRVPVEAGLAEHFSIVWAPSGHAAGCKAFALKGARINVADEVPAQEPATTDA